MVKTETRYFSPVSPVENIGETITLRAVSQLFENLKVPLVGYKSLNNKLQIAYDVELQDEAFTLNLSFDGSISSRILCNLEMSLSYSDYLQEAVDLKSNLGSILEQIQNHAMYRELRARNFKVNPEGNFYDCFKIVYDAERYGCREVLHERALKAFLNDAEYCFGKIKDILGIVE